MTTTDISTSPPLLIDQLSPDVVSAIQANKAALISAAGGPIARMALMSVWSFLMIILPLIARLVYIVVLKHFGGMAINDFLVQMTADYAAVKASDPAMLGINAKATK